MFPFTKAIRFLKKVKDLTGRTWCRTDIPIITNTFIHLDDLDPSEIDKDAVEFLGKMYLKHKFDLLGSAWVENSYTSKAPGFEGIKFKINLKIPEFDNKGIWLSHVLHPRHISHGRKIWKLVDEDYIPIDWQKDIKSGFRWNAKKWYLSQRNKYYRGADLKVPWEISRMYHLPQIAIFSILDTDLTETYIREFRNQVLDFTATNPPRMGVNWTTTMEVSIRAINMLIAYDLFCQLDKTSILDKDFKQVFANSMFEHGKHILNNLEFNKKLTSNHYLSNITGTLFISVYLQPSDFSIQCLLFSIGEVKDELFKQFLSDGVNFESSTSYHRLSAEMMVLSLSLINRLSRYNKESIFGNQNLKADKIKEIDNAFKSVLNNRVFERIYRIGQFACDLIKPGGEAPEFGDNDSGRILKLTPVGQMMSVRDLKDKYLHLRHIQYDMDRVWDENILIQGPLLAYFDGLFQNSGFEEHGKLYPLEKSILQGLNGGNRINKPSINKLKIFKSTGVGDPANLGYSEEHIINPDNESSIPLDQDIHLFSYPESKFYIFRSSRIYLAINAMSNGQNGNGGHCHNDKLSIELNMDGRDVYVDPGTYIYTSCPNLRNLFRSQRYHNTPVIEGYEQNRWRDGIHGLFHLSKDASCELIDCADNFIHIYLKFRDIEQVRQVMINRNHIQIRDFSNKPFKSFYNNFRLYSNGYGKLIKFDTGNDIPC